MSRVPGNALFKKQNDRLLPATFKKGFIVKVYTNSSTADVYFQGNSQTIIKSIPLSSAIDPLNVNPGDKCRVDCFDETNPSDMVVAYIYGRTFNQPSASFGTGTASVTPSGVSIAHGLGVIPDIIGFVKTSNPDSSQTVTGGGGGVYIANIDVFQFGAPDATNIYLKAPLTTMSVNWFAIKF